MDVFTALDIDFKKLNLISEWQAWAKDTEGQYIDCNDVQAEFYKLARQDLVGRTDLDVSVLNNHDAINCRNNDQMVITNNQTIWFTEPATINNKLDHYLSIKAPLYNQDKKIMGTFGLCY